MDLRDIESTLPPGFRFHPSDEELVCHYLYRKAANVKVHEGTMVEVDLHTREPWELPDGAKLGESDWYFFSFRDRKYATGSRTNRATKSGYWKATGKDRIVYHPKTRGIVGMRKTLVFYSGRAPNGMKTAWVMHEFRIENPRTPPKEDWVLCRVSHRRKGEQTSPSLEHERELKLGYSNLESTLPLVDQSVPCGCFDMMGVPHQEGSSSHNMIFHDNLSGYLHHNFLDLREQGLDISSMTNGMDMGMGSSKDDDEFGLFSDGCLLLDDIGVEGLV